MFIRQLCEISPIATVFLFVSVSVCLSVSFVRTDQQDQLDGGCRTSGNHLNFRKERAFTTLVRSRFEFLLAHVAPERLLATVGRSQFKYLTFKSRSTSQHEIFAIAPFDRKWKNLTNVPNKYLR